MLSLIRPDSLFSPESPRPQLHPIVFKFQAFLIPDRELVDYSACTRAPVQKLQRVPRRTHRLACDGGDAEGAAARRRLIGSDIFIVVMPATTYWPSPLCTSYMHAPGRVAAAHLLCLRRAPQFRSHWPLEQVLCCCTHARTRLANGFIFWVCFEFGESGTV